MENTRIPLHHVHEALGARIIPFGGFEMPVRYSSDKEEHLAVRNGVGVFDVSHMGEFLVEGPHALALIQKVTSNDAAKLIDGQAQYSCLPNYEGGIVDDLIVYRFNIEKYLLVVFRQTMIWRPLYPMSQKIIASLQYKDPKLWTYCNPSQKLI